MGKSKKCDLCGAQTGFRSFRCQDGVICKNCYLIVSSGYTETIAKRTLHELKQIYVRNTLVPGDQKKISEDQ